jgi:hypothetical protein
MAVAAIWFYNRMPRRASMFIPSTVPRGTAILLLGICAAMLLAPVLGSNQSGAGHQEKTADPWTKAQVLEAADLVRELGNSKD